MKTLKKKWQEKEYVTFLYILFFLFMTIYYGVRLFQITPWYDELYTYWSFVRKGPIYSAIHWPLPNNHVGYSVLSGFLSYFGNGYIALRGISYLAALANLLLVWLICKKLLSEEISFLVVLVYSSMQLVNSLAVQGRGYTLATTCFLISIYALIIMQENPNKKIGPILWILSLFAGLYIIPSSLYWVLAVCIAGGVYLLCKKNYQGLVRLILYSVVSAVLTVIAYGTIWLAIGSNLLIKDETSAFYGLGHVGVIIKHPFAAAKAGIDYMLSMPYIQSVERQGYLVKLWDWYKYLLNYYYSGFAILILIIIFVAIVFLHVIWKKKTLSDKMKLSLIVCDSVLLFTPILLIIQSKLPYYRVFSYMGFGIAFLVGLCLEQIRIARKLDNQMGIRIEEHDQDDAEKKGNSQKTVQWKIVAFCFLCILFLNQIRLLSSDAYMAQYGDDEHAIEEAYRQVDVKQYQNICVADCNSQYILSLNYNIECENIVVDGCDLLLLHKDMLNNDNQDFKWEYYLNYDTIDFDYVRQNMDTIYENDYVVLYVKR